MDMVAFIVFLLTCSHWRPFHEGLLYFESIGSIYGIFAKVENCDCMVDLIGNVGHLQEAKDFINTMSCNPNGLVWMALLMVCIVHCNWEMGEQVARWILDLEPGKCYMLCVAIKPLAVGGKWDLKANVELLIKKSLVWTYNQVSTWKKWIL